MRYFKVNGTYINLDLTKQIYIKHEGKGSYKSYNIYADDIFIIANNILKAAEINLDILMSKIKSGKESY